MGARQATESQEQKAVIQWADLNKGKYPGLGLLYHIPNGGARDARTGRNLKAEGVKAGVPDLHLPVPRGQWPSLYIEMKRAQGSRLSAAQLKWIDDLRRQGNRVEVCHGFADAVSVIRDYYSYRHWDSAPDCSKEGIHNDRAENTSHV